MTREKLSELIFINLGRASMCWSELPRGTFDSTTAVELGEDILKAIDEYLEDKQPGWSDAMSDYLEEEIAKYKDVPTIVVKKEDSKLMKDLKDAVVSDEPDGGWMNQYYLDYIKLRDSGMMFEWHPTWTGQWGKDKYAFCYNKNKKK
jgi:hypothetical protein